MVFAQNICGVCVGLYIGFNIHERDFRDVRVDGDAVG
jgi:hypothetical protein